MESPLPILPDVSDKQVAFEIAIEREGGGEEEEEEEEEEERGERKGWKVLRTYEDFERLHAALLARFYPGMGEEECPLKPPGYIGLREGKSKERVLLRVVDVVSRYIFHPPTQPL